MLPRNNDCASHRAHCQTAIKGLASEEGQILSQDAQGRVLATQERRDLLIAFGGLIWTLGKIQLDI
jgi:hypothetical protein